MVFFQAESQANEMQKVETKNEHCQAHIDNIEYPN